MDSNNPANHGTDNPTPVNATAPAAPSETSDPNTEVDTYSDSYTEADTEADIETDAEAETELPLDSWTYAIPLSSPTVTRSAATIAVNPPYTSTSATGGALGTVSQLSNNAQVLIIGAVGCLVLF